MKPLGPLIIVYGKFGIATLGWSECPTGPADAATQTIGRAQQDKAVQAQDYYRPMRIRGRRGRRVKR